MAKNEKLRKKEENYGKIYVVATPIGNLADFSPRAQEVLREVDVIAAEDTRHSKPLMDRFNIHTSLASYHEHNEIEKTEIFLERVKSGQNLALISDAGTPLISDPGFHLVREARAIGIKVIPIPGPCAAIAALSVAGLPCDKYLFLGFFPAKSSARQTLLRSQETADFTVIFYESCHRIMASLQDIAEVMPNRKIVIARELTKVYETVLSGTAAELLEVLKNDLNQQKGEFVILLAPNVKKEQSQDIDLQKLLEILLKEVPLKKAVDIAGKITKVRKNQIYQIALMISNNR